MELQMERDNNAKAMKNLRKLLNHGRSAPLETYGTDMASEMTQIERDTFAYAKEVIRWILIFGVIFIGGCLTGKAFAYSGGIGADDSRGGNSLPISAPLTFTDEEAIKSIIGEAENQGWIGMRAVAFAIRNRRTLDGVYGLHAPRVKKHLYSQATYQMAKRQWLASDGDYDFTHGANHWENIHAFGTPCWVKHCVETFRYKNHVFYKEVAQ
jgi:hypothetical protein